MGWGVGKLELYSGTVEIVPVGVAVPAVVYDAVGWW